MPFLLDSFPSGCCLVGGLEHGWIIFPIILASWKIIPTDFHSLHHFSEGLVGSQDTNQL
jgi:hypothetical protein